MGMLGQVENGEKINAKKLCMSAFHTPAFIASVLGILAGLSEVVICLIDKHKARGVRETKELMEFVGQPEYE